MNEKEIKLLFSFTDDIGETATLEKTFNDCSEIGTLTVIGFKPMDSEIIDKIGRKYHLYM